MEHIEKQYHNYGTGLQKSFIDKKKCLSNSTQIHYWLEQGHIQEFEL